ncbi:MAG: hypothetical protein WKF78_08325 [Candidatus Limnocylindrales bacterium]
MRAGIGPVPRAPTRIVVAGDRVGLAGVPGPAVEDPPTRLRLLRDTAMTLTGIAAVILVASALLAERFGGCPGDHGDSGPG